MGNQLEIHGTLLARNTLLNLLGQLVPLLVGLATIPYVLRGLGSEGFGILSIAWVLLGYFALFDLGLARATTKFVAECLGRDEIHRLPGLVWTSLGFQLLLGAAGGLLVGALTPVLVERVLKIPPSLVGETQTAFFILAASLPVALATSALRGVLEAAQRFDLVNYVKVPASISVFLFPAIALSFGLRLPGIVLLLVSSRLCETLMYLAFCLKIFPVIRSVHSFDSKLLAPLAGYGGWVTVTNLVGPILTYMDRFLIGALLTMSAVAYYTVPYEAVTRILAIPGSLVATVFPAISSLEAIGSMGRVKELYARSLKSLLLFLGPVLLVIVVFARDILQVWMGSDFAATSAPVLQILAIGVLINSLTFVPFAFLQAVGRPDLPAKFHLLELPIHAALLWFLLDRAGIVGAALAWAFRVCVDALLLFGTVFRLRLASSSTFGDSGLQRAILVVLGFAAALTLPSLTTETFLTPILLLSFLVPVFFVGAWSFVLDRRDRSLLTSAVSQFISVFGRAR